MKKYRILKLETEGDTTYCIQKRFLLFWWIGLDSHGDYEDWFTPTCHYQTLHEAQTALKKFNVKKIIVEKL
jgi:hypothetical protein